MGKYSVTFYPDDVAVQVEEGTSIFQAASQAGIELKSTCGNEGTCGRCAVKVKQGKIRTEGNIPPRLRHGGYVLSCHSYVHGNIVVEIPKDSRLDEHQVLIEKLNGKSAVLAEKQLDILDGYVFDPLCQKIYVQLSPPTKEENASDWTRLRTELKRQLGQPDIRINLPNLRILAETLRQGNWAVTVTVANVTGIPEVVHLEPGKSEKGAYGLAIDIGTTTVVVYLVDLTTGSIMDKAGTYNKQARFGDDVISRMIYASSEPDGLEQLHRAVVSTINQLLEKLLTRNGISADDLQVAVAAGNTTMTHLFLGVPPKYIRLDPYIPTATDFPAVRAQEIGLNINPNARVVTFASVGSYVGGDIVSGILVTKITHRDETILFIDIGTNGEMVLGNRDWMLSCACSAGPAFEGGGITFGMRAMKGAIERVEIHPETFEVEVSSIGNYRPIGICGSGLIDCIAKLRRVGLIDRTGKFNLEKKSSRLRKTDDDVEFVLVWGAETECGKDIVLTEADIKNIIRSKAAVYAGIQSMLKTVQMDLDSIDRVLIAGGFGNYLNIRDSIELGLLPDIPLEKYEFVGNTSVKGAHLALISRSAFQESADIGHKLTYIELSLGNTFMDEFVSALFLPHTNLSLFPSIAV